MGVGDAGGPLGLCDGVPIRGRGVRRGKVGANGAVLRWVLWIETLEELALLSQLTSSGGKTACAWLQNKDQKP